MGWIAFSTLSLLINKGFKEIGFDYVALDLSGYRTGSMNLDV